MRSSVRPGRLPAITNGYTAFGPSRRIKLPAHALRTRALSTASPPRDSSPLEILRRVKDLQDRVGRENSKAAKQAIIAEYPDLRELLEYVYDPDRRTHLSFASLRKHLQASSLSIDPSSSSSTTPSIIAILDRLSSRQLTGHAAKDHVAQYLSQSGVLGESELLETFGKLLDRNLVAGFGARTLKEVPWAGVADGDPRSTQTGRSPTAGVLPFQGVVGNPPVTQSRLDHQQPQPTSHTPLHPHSTTLDKFEVALGKSLEPPFDVLFKDPQTRWFASRKLDGVRCLTFVDILVPSGSEPAPLEIASIHFVSRTGRAFSCLAKLEEQLVHLARLPEMRKWLEADPLVVEQRQGGMVKRLVLDGEVCVMRPRTAGHVEGARLRDAGSSDSGPGTSSDSAPATRQDAAGEMWSVHEPFVEDFPSTISAMRRPGTISHLSYFIFDVLSYSEIAAKSAVAKPGLGKTFSQRVEDIMHLQKWLSGELARLGIAEKMAKDLRQVEVRNKDDLEGMVQRAAEEGWEGLILRKDDVYKGKRSNDIRKFKQWQDAEYTVLSLDVNTMRLAIDGVFDTYEAMANVWIEHEGHKVSVGSGFTAEQRVRYARSPDDIIGKAITVQYFSESTAVERGQEGGKSLRFPRVKAVWEEGRRGM
ncbi:hypothetical protein IAU60_005400 [Kwoniella sp. DSM 27419]